MQCCMYAWRVRAVILYARGTYTKDSNLITLGSVRYHYVVLFHKDVFSILLALQVLQLSN